MVEDGGLILFQGDSITDCGRDRNNPASLGGGYAMMAASWFSASQPEAEMAFVNRGISGNRVKDLKARWKTDCLDLKPSLVSIFIGINDVWRRYDSNDPTSCADFEDGYRDILRQTKRALDADLVILEPFVLPVPRDRVAWREDLDPKIQAVRRLAKEFEAIYVPLDGIFAAACTKREPEFWAADGVHPTNAGHALIAQAWLDAVGL